VEYALTPTGQEVGALLHPLMAWIAANADDILSEAG
jgi:DNA-binding HxlR family transcriptional regulator